MGEVTKRQLYSYFRSSAAYRVRIALEYKALDYEVVPVHLLKDGGEQRKAEYLALNPQGLLPTLKEEGQVLTQSLSILEYLEEAYPEPEILPAERYERAWVRALSQTIACDIHPLNNLRVLQYLSGTLGITEEAKQRWIELFIEKGFMAFESMLHDKSPKKSVFCHGSTPTMADICLIPQVYNALRFNVDMSRYPKILSIYEHAMAQPYFVKASPEAQQDAYS